jgi:hypothetical protein
MKDMLVLLALAQAQGPGEKIKEEFVTQFGALFLTAVVIISVILLAKRAFSMFLGFVLFAMFVSVFVFQPENIQALGEKTWEWLFADLVR